MGGAGARASPVIFAPFLREGTTIRVLSDAPSRFFFRRDGISIRPYRYTLPPKMTKKNDDLHFKRFFQCFVFLIDVPSGKKGRKFLINVPFVRFSLFTYPPGRFFRNYAFLRGARRNPARSGLKGTWIRVVFLFLSPLLMHPSVTSTPPSAFAGFKSLARRFSKICGEIFLSIFSSSLR